MPTKALADSASPLVISELGGGSTGHLLCDCLSVDVEDYFHVEAFRERIDPRSWPDYQSRVVENTRRVIRLLSRSESRATFFILGWVAERHPQLVREILAAGHEIGCHSYWHNCIWRLTPKQFREDTRRARCAIEDAAGQRVRGYRAPSFSIVERSLWALEILAEEGFVYDSSVFPIRHDVYGLPRAPRFPFRWANQRGHLLFELPPTTARVCGWNLPAGGGAYLRILPGWYTDWAFRKVHHEGKGLVVYFHPWEIDPQQPRLAGRLRSRFRHYFHLDKMESRLDRMLSAGKFVPLIEYLAAFEYGLRADSKPASVVRQSA